MPAQRLKPTVYTGCSRRVPDSTPPASRTVVTDFLVAVSIFKLYAPGENG